MKATIIPTSHKTQYPVLKVSSRGLVVLFTGKDTGIVIKGDDYNHPGTRSCTWDENIFTPLQGTLVLEND